MKKIPEKPIGTMTVDGYTGTVTLEVFAKTKFLAITRESIGYQITHIPTGLKVPRYYSSLADAQQVFKALKGLDWDWGWKWTAELKRKLNGFPKPTRYPDRARSQAALKAAVKIVNEFDEL